MAAFCVPTKRNPKRNSKRNYIFRLTTEKSCGIINSYKTYKVSRKCNGGKKKGVAQVRKRVGSRDYCCSGRMKKTDEMRMTAMCRFWEDAHA